ncbi:hypothetical protein KQI86_12450 [Clostridium sp. MSJ-11]|uniref:Uncharacterized protein n=1 Tax=Clostridium mobile TaxID=2841512 RepID=A0ABS6EIV7_9CLOT|nr:DUF6514 family protein [Clostridium mobile]MBU5485146.1 hypothetical protein [Clostridium mobile]
MVIVENIMRSVKTDEMEHSYYYRMLKSNISLNYSNQSVEVQAYGIEVERQDIKDGKVINIERNYVRGISPQRYKVHKLLKLLYDNSVSPIHLIDILGDYIDEYIVDFDKELMDIAMN